MEVIKKITNLIKQILFYKSSWEIYRQYTKIHPTALIDPVASIKIYNPTLPPSISLEINEGSHIFSNFSLLRPHAKIKIGKNCQLGNSNFICADRIEVGDDVLMAWGVTIIDNDSHSLEWNYRKSDVKQGYKDYLEDENNFIKNKDWSHVNIKPIYIGNKVWIGFNVSILKGVSVGNNAIIGACSVVTKDIPPYTLVAGNPAKIIKNLSKKL